MRVCNRLLQLHQVMTMMRLLKKGQHLDHLLPTITGDVNRLWAPIAPEIAAEFFLLPIHLVSGPPFHGGFPSPLVGQFHLLSVGFPCQKLLDLGKLWIRAEAFSRGFIKFRDLQVVSIFIITPQVVRIQLTKSVIVAFSNFAMVCASSLGGSGLAAVPPALPLVPFCPFAPLVFGPASIRPAGGECGELCSSSDSGVGVRLVNGVGTLR